MNNKIIPFTLVALGFLLGATALSALAQTWTAPTCSPPNCNVPAPVNVGSSWQYKSGPLSIGTNSQVTPAVSLDVVGGGLFDNLGISGTFILHSGSPQQGEVLTAQDNSGTAAWQTPASGGVTQITAGSNITISPTSGLGNVTINSLTPTVNVSSNNSSNSSTQYSPGPTGAYYHTNECPAGQIVTGVAVSGACLAGGGGYGSCVQVECAALSAVN